MNEKRSRDRAVLGALGVRFDDELETTETPDFDAGPRTDHRPYEPSRRPTPYREGAWETIEIEDGAELFFGTPGR